MIPPFIYVSRCGLRRTAYCSGREETRCAEICQQRVELLDDVLYACRIGNSCRRARIARSSRARRTCGTGRTNSARCSFNTLRPLRACGACGTRLTLRSGRPNGARRTGDALKTLYTLRPRRPDRTGNTLNALHALRPRRAQHILRRERRRRKRRGAGRRAAVCTAARILKTIHRKYPPFKLGAGKLLRFILCRGQEEVSAIECARFVNNGEKPCNASGGMLTYNNMFYRIKMFVRTGG